MFVIYCTRLSIVLVLFVELALFLCARNTCHEHSSRGKFSRVYVNKILRTRFTFGSTKLSLETFVLFMRLAKVSVLKSQTKFPCKYLRSERVKFYYWVGNHHCQRCHYHQCQNPQSLSCQPNILFEFLVF